MRSLKEHPHIVKLLEVHEEKNEIIMILELMEGKNLYEFIKDKKKMDEQQIYQIFEQILKGVTFLHSNHVLHRDLKLENILFSKDNENLQLKIADFTLSTFFQDDSDLFNDFCGTPGCMAPEIFTRNGYSKEIDIYSLGIILYNLYKIL